MPWDQTLCLWVGQWQVRGLKITKHPEKARFGVKASSTGTGDDLFRRPLRYLSAPALYLPHASPSAPPPDTPGRRSATGTGDQPLGAPQGAAPGPGGPPGGPGLDRPLHHPSPGPGPNHGLAGPEAVAAGGSPWPGGREGPRGQAPVGGHDHIPAEAFVLGGGLVCSPAAGGPGEALPCALPPGGGEAEAPGPGVPVEADGGWRWCTCRGTVPTSIR